MAYVYLHRKICNNEVFYVGIGSDNNYKRAKDRSQRGKHWKDFIKKHKYSIEITHDNILWEEACSIEKYLISFYGRKDLGLGALVNKTDGGDGAFGVIVSDETKKILSEKLKGKTPWCKGLRLPEETKNKMSSARMGRKFSEESKIKIGLAHRGKIVSQETRQKISKYNNGSDSKFYVGDIEVFKNGISVGVYEGTGHCKRELGLNESHIISCIKGRRKQHGGYTFRRIYLDKVR